MNEKVYTVSLVGIAIIAWLTVRWCDEPDGPKADKHPRPDRVPPRTRLREPHGRLARGARGGARGTRSGGRRRCSGGSCCSPASAPLMVGMTPFATQPIRAAYFPAINEGEPTGCRTEARVDVHVREADAATRSCTTSTAAVRQAVGRRAAGAVHRAGRDVVAVLQVAVDARRAPAESRRCRPSSPRCSSCSGSSAAACTTSETDEVSGSSGR